jgi:hypothetical protein
MRTLLTMSWCLWCSAFSEGSWTAMMKSPLNTKMKVGLDLKVASLDLLGWFYFRWRSHHHLWQFGFVVCHSMQSNFEDCSFWCAVQQKLLSWNLLSYLYCAVNGRPRPLESAQVKHIREELQDIRDRVSHLVDQLSCERSDAPVVNHVDKGSHQQSMTFCV